MILTTLVFLPLPSHAAVEVWNFFGPQLPFPNAPTSPAVDIAGPYPLSVTNADGFTVKLTPFASTGVQGVLTGRNLGAGTDEQGAGVHAVGAGITSDTTTFEINGAESLRIDLASGLFGWEVRFNSLAPNEVAHVWAGSVGGIDLGTVAHIPGALFESKAIPNADASLPIFVTADSADVLVYGVAAIPEPATLFLLGLGLFGVGIQRKKAIR